jgi:hypothetical protein
MIGAITDDDFDVNVLCFRLVPFELSIAKHGALHLEYVARDLQRFAVHAATGVTVQNNCACENLVQ